MFGVVIPVGPGDRDVARLNSLVSELRRHECAEKAALLIIDDGRVARRLRPDWPSATVLRTHVREAGRPDLFSAHVAGTLEAFEQVRREGLEFAVKLDTDAAIIGSFSGALRAAFTDPSLGVVGSYDRTSTGATRDWSMWRGRIDAADRPLAVRRVGRGVRLVRHSRRDREHVRALRTAAYAQAPAGAHCLGGAYAVSGEFIRAASLAWEPWVGTGLGEDVVVGLLCSAAHLTMRSLTAAREPFALSWRGLPGDPLQIAAQGHTIVHSVKADTDARERTLRDELQSAAASSDAGND